MGIVALLAGVIIGVFGNRFLQNPAVEPNLLGSPFAFTLGYGAWGEQREGLIASFVVFNNIDGVERTVIEVRASSPLDPQPSFDTSALVDFWTTDSCASAPFKMVRNEPSVVVIPQATITEHTEAPVVNRPYSVYWLRLNDGQVVRVDGGSEGAASAAFREAALDIVERCLPPGTGKNG